MVIEANTHNKCEGERNTETDNSFMSFYMPFSLRLLVPLERCDKCSQAFLAKTGANL